MGYQGYSDRIIDELYQRFSTVYVQEIFLFKTDIDQCNTRFYLSALCSYVDDSHQKLTQSSSNA